MIKFISEGVTDNGTKKLGFIGENEEAMRSLSLNCDITTLTRERPLINLEISSNLPK